VPLSREAQRGWTKSVHPKTGWFQDRPVAKSRIKQVDGYGKVAVGVAVSAVVRQIDGMMNVVECVRPDGKRSTAEVVVVEYG